MHLKRRKVVHKRESGEKDVATFSPISWCQLYLLITKAAASSNVRIGWSSNFCPADADLVPRACSKEYVLPGGCNQYVLSRKCFCVKPLGDCSIVVTSETRVVPRRRRKCL